MVSVPFMVINRNHGKKAILGRIAFVLFDVLMFYIFPNFPFKNRPFLLEFPARLTSSEIFVLISGVKIMFSSFSHASLPFTRIYSYILFVLNN